MNLVTFDCIISSRVKNIHPTALGHDCPMDVTFGAVGDFIAIGILIKDLVELLDDSRGSSWEYQALAEQLRVLGRVIDCAEEFCRQQCDTDDLRDTRDGLKAVIDETKRRRQGVAEKLSRYKTSLAAGGSRNRAKDAARKVRWRIEKREIDKFRDDVMQYANLIQSLLLTIMG